MHQRLKRTLLTVRDREAPRLQDEGVESPFASSDSGGEKVGGGAPGETCILCSFWAKEPGGEDCQEDKGASKSSSGMEIILYFDLFL